MHIKSIVLNLSLLVLFHLSNAQNGHWQQRVEYKMQIDFNVDDDTFKGSQELTYFNNSPDTLFKVFYHLYFNAFQPGSMMDVRSRTITDPDHRIMSRVYGLQPNEIGYHKIKSLKKDGKKLDFHVEGTVLEVELDEPILPSTSTVFEMKFESQVPIQIRRSGRDNKEGIRYSMAQWYPKMAEYDKTGWHAHPYIAREFYSPWGDFDIEITMDERYMIAGGGKLLNPEEIGYGYDESNSRGKTGKKGKLTWHFQANDVHDFVWTADPDYIHDVMPIENGPTVHFFYQGDTLVENWQKLQGFIKRAFPYISKNFGKYPYDQYSIIQGGDGGMEYPMATLIRGHRTIPSLVGVSVHEILHSWYQMILATNESYYPWMDEGFTSYASAWTMNYLFNNEDPEILDASKLGYKSYFRIVQRGLEEPLSTHSDHFMTNAAYGTAAYSKGSLTLNQLGYVIGARKLKSGMLRYFNAWKFKHPDKDDFIRIMEKESGLELDWYFDYWINTTKTIDYGIKSVTGKGKKTSILLEKVGDMPMPIDIEVELTDGTIENYYTALGIMRGEKEVGDDTTVLSDWPWVNPYYTFEVPHSLEDIKRIEIDATKRMADVDRENNVYPFDNELEFIATPKK